MDRIVYILHPEGNHLSCLPRLTKLMKWEAFSETDFSDLRSLFRAQYASYLRPEDRSIIMGLLQLQKRDGEPPVLDGEYGHEVFNRMLATGRLFHAEGSHVRLKSAAPEVVQLDWSQNTENRWQATASLRPGARPFALNPPIYIDGQAAACGPLHHEAPAGLISQWLEPTAMNESEVSRFCLRLAKRFPAADFPVPPCVKLNAVTSDRPVTLLTIEQRSLLDARESRSNWIDLRDRLRLRLRFRYGEAVVAWDALETTVSHRDQDTIVRTARDRTAEKLAIDQLETWGFAVDPGRADAGFFNFDSTLFVLRPGHAWRTWISQVAPGLDTTQWQVEQTPGLTITLAAETDAYTDINSTSDTTFAVAIGVTISGRKHPLLPTLHQALRQMGRDLRHADLGDWFQKGDFALRIPSAHPEDKTSTHLVSLPAALLVPLIEQVHEVFDARPFAKDGRAQLSQWRVAELVAAGWVESGSDDRLAELSRLCERLGSGLEISPRSAPLSLHATLRPYQQHGLGWLHSLGSVSAGGILADDMGLGKTVQVIAHLLESKASGDLANGALIVTPTSVIDNWAEELARFAPTLKVGRHHGSDRDQHWHHVAGQDVTLTTYALLWRDISRLAPQPWDLVVLDEAQYIKNASARTAQAARNLSATRRLCLTGTPVENRLQDIWSLFEFLLPGFLGDEATFKQRIAAPLTDDPEDAFATILRDRLRRRLAPFVLRRLKEDVLPDLPAKTEVVHAVAMTPHQSDLYFQMRREARDHIRESVEAHGLGGARMQILTRLLRLRQICCDPRLLDEDRNPSDHLHDSAKLTALLDLVADLRARGSRTLIFSQFTSMLDLIATALKAEGHDFLMLTGSTSDRAALVQRFQTGECPLFLISLRAGGSGLNLTAADSVIHYDPWWNPAVERQATDRTHRIGQTKPVFVYKLIVDDSIESRIQELQHTKLEMVRDLLNAGDIDHLSLDQDSIDYLLAD